MVLYDSLRVWPGAGAVGSQSDYEEAAAADDQFWDVGGVCVVLFLGDLEGVLDEAGCGVLADVDAFLPDGG